ncbi:hypothetical protein ACETK8_04380 [Brevundimonas staleyi]|uniref:Uncharacterized protein n=1 Tax=Brevundimonas staleyi TaxID=74326 RepID=A0ABW0FYB5_9CAUL
MKTMMMAAALALLPMTAMAQATGTTGATGVGMPIEAPVLAGATLDPACGNLYNMAGKAFCVTAPLAAIGGIAEAYITHFESEGWIAAGGDDNRVVFVKRRDGGGCDGMQMQAFYDTNRPAGPDVPGYIGMATIPGNVCADPNAAATPQ